MQRILVQLQQINAAVTNNYTYYTVSSYFQLAQAYDMNSTHVSSGSSSSSGDWKSRQTLCLQTVHQMLSHLWLFKMESPRLLPICQCSSKSDGKDAAVCGSALHLSVHVLYGDGRFRCLRPAAHSFRRPNSS